MPHSCRCRPDGQRPGSTKEWSISPLSSTDTYARAHKGVQGAQRSHAAMLNGNGAAAVAVPIAA